MLSTAFAEVVSGSDKFPFLLPWGLIVTNPLYSLHILVLATILVRWRRLSWPGLCFAGALFGLYEAYITKVLWNPDWAPGLAVAGEVAWLHTVLLVLWWHPLMAFILPLLVAETLLTRSRNVLGTFPPRWQERFRDRTGRYVILLAMGCGLACSGNAPDLSMALLSPLVNCLLFLLLIGLWRRTPGRAYSLEELLPGRLAFVVFCAGLAVMYLVLGALLLPERFPGFMGHALILLLYAFFIFLLLRSPAPGPAGCEAPASANTHFRWRWPFAFTAAFTLTAFAAKAVLGPAAAITLLANWALACTVGVAVYAKAVWQVLLPAQDH